MVARTWLLLRRRSFDCMIGRGEVAVVVRFDSLVDDETRYPDSRRSYLIRSFRLAVVAAGIVFVVRLVAAIDQMSC